MDRDGSAIVTYSGLTAFDADGVILPARIERVHEGLALVVDERGARYPLTIDPIAQQAYLKASNTDAEDGFGFSLAVADETLLVGVLLESSSATGVNGDQSDNSAEQAGAAYAFELPPPECFLVLGAGPGASAFLEINHVFDTQVGPSVEST